MKKIAVLFILFLIIGCTACSVGKKQADSVVDGKEEEQLPSAEELVHNLVLFAERGSYKTLSIIDTDIVKHSERTEYKYDNDTRYVNETVTVNLQGKTTTTPSRMYVQKEERCILFYDYDYETNQWFKVESSDSGLMRAFETYTPFAEPLTDLKIGEVTPTMIVVSGKMKFSDLENSLGLNISDETLFLQDVQIDVTVNFNKSNFSPSSARYELTKETLKKIGEVNDMKINEFFVEYLFENTESNYSVSIPEDIISKAMPKEFKDIKEYED